MKKLNIVFKVSHQSIWRADAVRLVTESKNYVRAIFEFSNDWDGITKTAIFKKGENVYHVILEDDACMVPWEVLATDGSFIVSVFGGDLITADSAYIRVTKSAYEDGGAPAEPTPSVYEQVISALESKVAESDLDGTSIYKGEDGKIHAVGSSGGSEIDDEHISTATTYSSQKIENLITSKGYVTDEQVDALVTSKGYQTAEQVATKVTQEFEFHKSEFVTPTVMNQAIADAIGGAINGRY